MSLGYALLHRTRIEAALGATARKRTYDETFDIAFGALGAGDPGPGFQEFLRTRSQSFQAWIDRVTGASGGASGPLGAFRNLFTGEPPDVGDLSSLLTRLQGLVANVGQFKDTLRGWLHGFIDALPDLSGAALMDLVRGQVRDLTLILERRYQDGQRDAAAQRGFRSAVTIRQLIGSTLDQVAEGPLDFDVRAMLRGFIDSIVQQLGGSGFDRLAAAVGSFQGQFGGLFSALASFQVSASVSASAGVGAPQGMADAPTHLDDVKAAPHPVGDALWVLDLVTNIFACFNSIWELARTRNFSGRGFDGFLSVLMMLWQMTHTVMRSAFRDSINLQSATDDHAGRRVLNWFFTDQANLSINLFHRLLGSWIYETGAACDWALSIAQRMMKFFTNVVNVRIYYWFFRSWWYFRDWKERGFTGEGENRVRTPVSLNRTLWAAWGPWYFMSFIGGLIPAWEDFTLEKGLGKTRTWLPLLIFGLLGIVGGYLALGLLSDHNPFTLDIARDWPTFVLIAALTILGVIGLCIIVDNLESESKGGAWAGVGILIAILAIGIVCMAITFGTGTTGGFNSFTLFWQLFFCGLLPACVLPFILWWYYIDDSRDKLGLFEGKDPDTSPYKLPFPAGENWICGQGVHGIFSHYPIDPAGSDSDNHYAYDFNERQNKFAFAARAGIVVNLEEFNENDKQEPNFIDVQHLTWDRAHDPGAENEGVLTRTTYFHLSRNRVWTDFNHRFLQGYHIADIDNTGRSALNHLHYHVEETQRGRFLTLPSIFKDDSVRAFRNYPLLAWIPGKGHIPGKPITMAYYVSDNTESAVGVNPVLVLTAVEGTPPHMHALVIDRQTLGGAVLPASVTLFTTVSEGHFHSITLDSAALTKILSIQDLTGLVVLPANGHSHTLLSRTRNGPTTRIISTEDGTFPHSHVVDIARDPLWTDVWPATLSLTTDSVDDDGDTKPRPAHLHTLPVNRDELMRLFSGDMTAFILPAAPSDHTHTFLGSTVLGPSSRQVTPVNPPAAQLLALQAGPYRLVGDQLVVRVNDRSTEYFFYGVRRPSLLADVALDRGLGATEQLQVATNVYALDAATTDQTVRGTARLLTERISTGAGGVASLPIAVLALPVIVLETRRRGRTASLEATAAGTAPLLAPGQSRSSTGGGAFADVGQIALTDLVNHLNSLLQNGWPAAPAGFTTAVTAGRLSLQIAGSPVDFTGSSGRLAQVLTRLYDVAAGALRLRATGPMPLATGRVDFGAPAHYQVPLLARPALLRIDTAHPAFVGTALTTTPLEITALGVPQALTLRTGDNAPAVLARRIAFEIEGVRAFADGATVVVESLIAGTRASLHIAKDTLTLDAVGAAPTLAGGSAVADVTSVAADQLRAVIQDALGRTTPAYDAAAASPLARLDAGRLIIEVAAGHTIEVAAVVLASGVDPFAFTRPENTRIESQVLSGPISVGGSGWLDLLIDGQPARIPLDGEGARLELGPMARLPVAGETLVLAINGDAPVTIPFAGTETNIRDVAAVIAAATDQVSVRLAHAWSVENSLYSSPGHTLQLPDSSGLAAVGFLRDRLLLTATARGVGTDQVNVPTALDDPTFRDNGEFVRAFEVAEQPSGADLIFTLTPTAGFEIRATPDPAAEPLGLPAGFASSLATSALGETIPLRSNSQQYRFDIREAGGATVATSRVQVNASPAVVRTRRAPVLPFAGASAVLNVTVVEPQAGGASVERSHTVDLAGAGTLPEVAQRLTSAVPGVRAWTAVRPAGSLLVLHLETVGAGTGWSLRLDNPALLVALGFHLPDIDLAAGRFTVTGRGNVRDARGVTRDEWRAAFQRALTCLTGLVSGAGSPVVPRRLRVALDGANLALSSLEGTVSVETDPPGLKAVLNVTEAAAQTTLAPGPNVRLDNGDIIIKAAARTLAVVHVWGDQAAIRAEQPLPDAASPEGLAMLALLRAHPLRVEVDLNVTTLGLLPAAVTTFEEAIQVFAAQVPAAWLGIVGGHVVLESRGRGSDRRIRMDFSQFASVVTYPTGTILGFSATQLVNAAVPADWQVPGNGRGSVPRLEQVATQGAVGSLEQLLRAAAAAGAAPQAVYDVEVDTSAVPTLLRVRTHAEADLLFQPTPRPPLGPGAIPFNPPAGGATPARILEASYSGAPALEPDVFELRTRTAGVDRSITVLFAGQPARLPALQLPANLTVLNNRGFTLTLADGVARAIVFSAPAGITASRIAAQIERQAGWNVRAVAEGTNLLLESLATGSAATLALSAPGGATPNAITGNPATGMVAPRALPIQQSAAGTVPNLDAVSAADFQRTLIHAFVAEATAQDTSTRDTRALNWQAYRVTPAPVPSHLRLRSQRQGCLSALAPIVLDAPALGLSGAFDRAPAIGGSVLLPAFTGTKNLSGTLNLQFNDNAGVEDLPAPVVVPVFFVAGAYSAADVARRIHQEVFTRGVGQAAAYADGTVVIETLVNGLAGSVRLPAPGAAPTGQDQVLLRDLIGTSPELFGRGWPGTGFNGAGGALRPGFRSRTGAARAAAAWMFNDGTTSTAAINVAAGQSLADLQRAVDAALRVGPTGRIGLCLLGPDETLFIEATDDTLNLVVDGNRLLATPASNPGQTPERKEEPAVGLRRTAETRTLFFFRDQTGNGLEGEFDNIGWVRVPARQVDATDATTGAITSEAGTPRFQIVFPSGRYWIAVRPDAAKTRDYDASGDMVIAGGVDPADANRFVVHRARYWVSLDGSQFLRVARTAGGVFLADVLLG